MKDRVKGVERKSQTIKKSKRRSSLLSLGKGAGGGSSSCSSGCSTSFLSLSAAGSSGLLSWSPILEQCLKSKDDGLLLDSTLLKMEKEGEGQVENQRMIIESSLGELSDKLVGILFQQLIHRFQTRPHQAHCWIPWISILLQQRLLLEKNINKNREEKKEKENTLMLLDQLYHLVCTRLQREGPLLRLAAKIQTLLLQMKRKTNTTTTTTDPFLPILPL